MSLNFNDEYFTTDENGMKDYRNFPHFRERALWIQKNLSGGILEIGCAYGFLIEELNKLGIPIGGIDVSEYAISQVNASLIDQVKVSSASVIDNYYDWIISWNVLDCLKDNADAEGISLSLNSSSENQLHIICMSGEDYKDQGYFIRDYNHWRSLLPDAYLVDFHAQLVHIPDGKPILSKIPLCGNEKNMSVTD